MTKDFFTQPPILGLVVGAQGTNQAKIEPRTGPKWSLKENRSIYLYDSFAKNVGNDRGNIFKEKLLPHSILGPQAGVQWPKSGPKRAQNGPKWDPQGLIGLKHPNLYKSWLWTGRVHPNNYFQVHSTYFLPLTPDSDPSWALVFKNMGSPYASKFTGIHLVLIY